jgi:hypothetical protein
MLGGAFGSGVYAVRGAEENEEQAENCGQLESQQHGDFPSQMRPMPNLHSLFFRDPRPSTRSAIAKVPEKERNAMMISQRKCTSPCVMSHSLQFSVGGGK